MYFSSLCQPWAFSINFLLCCLPFGIQLYNMRDFIPSKSYKSLVKQRNILANSYVGLKILFPIHLKQTKVSMKLTEYILKKLTIAACQNGLDKQGNTRSDCFWRSSLILVFPACYSDKHCERHSHSPGNQIFNLEQKERSVKWFLTSHQQSFS